MDTCVMTKIMLDMSNSLIDNLIGFSCDKEDLCDQQFMFDYLEWLFKVEYNNLELNIRPLLLTGNNQQIQCIIDNNNNGQLCIHHTCMTLRDGDSIKRSCGEVDATRLAIGTKISITKNNNQREKEKFQITESTEYFLYECDSNNCNENKTDQLINQILKDHYNLSSLHQMINNKFKTEYLPEPNITSTTSNTGTMLSFPRNNYSISNIILIYGLIFSFFI